jgi:hypothetical protein
MEGGLQVAVQLDPKEEAIEVAVSSGVPAATAQVLNIYTDLLTKPYFEF